MANLLAAGFIDFFCLFCLVANLTRPRAIRWTVPNVPTRVQSATSGSPPRGTNGSSSSSPRAARLGTRGTAAALSGSAGASVAMASCLQDTAGSRSFGSFELRFKW